MSGVPVRATVPAAMPAPPSTKETTTTCRERIAPLVVRLLLAQRRLASELSTTKVTWPSAVEAASARSTISCGGELGHRPASCTVLRMLTFSNRADGQPWLTGATWPGWALPQLNAPPST